MNTVLQKSAELMLSENYKDRFIAEFMQIDNRLKGLKSMLEKWNKGELSFTPTCPIETYNFQLKAMQNYRDILIIRARMEDIELPFYD